MIRTLLILITLVAAGYGAIKGYLFYRTAQLMDEMALHAAQYGELTYGDISSDLTGSITVADIRFQPRGASDSVHVDLARLTGPDTLFFLQLAGDIAPEEGKLPERFSVAMDGLQVDLQGDALTRLSAMAPNQPESVDACSNPNAMDAELLTEMGLKELVMDSRIGWDHDKASGELRMDMDMDIANMQSFNVVVTLAGVPANGFAGGSMEQLPELKNFDVRFTADKNFGEKFVWTCAKRKNVTPQEFQAQLSKQAVLGLLQSGIEPGFGIRQALETFYRDWGEIRLAARPAKPVGVLSMMMFPPDRLAEVLGLHLSVNERPVSNFSFKLVGPQGASNSGLAGMLGGQQQSNVGPPVRKKRYRTEVRTVGVAELPQYISKQVKVHSRGQPAKEGKLVSVNRKEIAVQQKLHGGKFTAHIPVGQIEKVDVMLRVRIKEKDGEGGLAEKKAG